MNIENNARLFLEFLDELDLVKILAATTDFGRPLVIMGAVKGKAQLVDLLEETGIDHYTTGGDPLGFPPSLPTAYEITPQRMVKTLDEGFRSADETQMKILRGEQPTEEELALSMPLSLRVFSSSTTTDEGLQRVSNWFAAHAPTELITSKRA